MMIDSLFLDANIFFTASISANGASRVLFELAKRNKLHLVANLYVLEESKRNLVIKADKHALIVFYQLMASLKKVDKSKFEENEYSKYASTLNLINLKDQPVFGGCLTLKATHLISLDKKAFDTIKNQKLPFQIMSPGEYLQSKI